MSNLLSKWGVIFTLLFLTGCNINTLGGETKTVRATCKLDNFKGFPKKVTGNVTFELKSFITIKIYNKDKSESVEITFPKDKCGAN